MTKRAMQSELLALRVERDELRAALTDAFSVFFRMASLHPHVAEGPCLHCDVLAKALEICRPLGRYQAENAATVAQFARDNPERYAVLRRMAFEGGGDVAAGGGA